MKKFNAKANPHFSYNEVSIEYNVQYEALITEFAQHIVLPSLHTDVDAKSILNKIHTNVIRAINVFKFGDRRHTFDFVLDVFDKYIESYEKPDIEIKVISSTPQKGTKGTILPPSNKVMSGPITKKNQASNTKSHGVNATKERTLFQKFRNAIRFTKKNPPVVVPPAEFSNPNFNSTINPKPDNKLPPLTKKRNPRNSLPAIPPQEQAPRIIPARQDRLPILPPGNKPPPRPAKGPVASGNQLQLGMSSSLPTVRQTNPSRPAPLPPGNKPPLRPAKGPVASLKSSTSGISPLLPAKNPNSQPPVSRPQAPPRPTSAKPVVTQKSNNIPPPVNRSTKPKQQRISNLIAKFEGTGK